jgi:hypothetical protein
MMGRRGRNLPRVVMVGEGPPSTPYVVQAAAKAWMPTFVGMTATIGVTAAIGVTATIGVTAAIGVTVGGRPAGLVPALSPTWPSPP